MRAQLAGSQAELSGVRAQIEPAEEKTPSKPEVDVTALRRIRDAIGTARRTGP
jgi:hypothetical protein